jgi:hypothetical protein
MAKVKYIAGSIRYEPTPEEKEKQKVYYISPMREEEDLEDLWKTIEKQDLTEARRAELKAKLETRRIQALKDLQDAQLALHSEGKKDTKEGKDPGKKYLVNLETGVIDVVGEGEGEYTYKDALLTSSSIKGKAGEYDKAVSLLKAARDLGEGKKEEAGPKKEWYVEDDGEIVHDPENGTLTLSEARAVSASKQRLRRGGDDSLSPEKLELKLRDLKEEWNKTIMEMEGRLREKLTPRDEGSPFYLDEKGSIAFNNKAKVSATDLLLWQFIKERQGTTVHDEHGNLLKVPDTATYLELQRFEREEHRKDKRNEQITSFIEDGRKQLPAIIETLRGRSKESEESMREGGWLKGGGSEVKTSPCPNPQCSQPLSYTTIPSIVTCPQCGALAFFGTPAQFQLIQNQIGKPKGESKPEETQGGDLRESETPSPPSSGAMNEAMPKQASD